MDDPVAQQENVALTCALTDPILVKNGGSVKCTLTNETDVVLVVQLQSTSTGGQVSFDQNSYTLQPSGTTGSSVPVIVSGAKLSQTANDVTITATGATMAPVNATVWDFTSVTCERLRFSKSM